MVEVAKPSRRGQELGHDVGDVGGLKTKRVAETVNVPDETIRPPSNHDIIQASYGAFNYCKGKALPPVGTPRRRDL
jgi:hypothetical protein